MLEAAEPALGKDTRKLRKRVKAVQSLLGDHHDTVVARAVLRELGGQAQVDGANGFTFGVLYAEERAAARALEARLPSDVVSGREDGGPDLTRVWRSADRVRARHE